MISAAYDSTRPVRAIVIASRTGSPTRSARASASRASTRADRASASHKFIPARWARIHTARASSPSASVRAWLSCSMIVSGAPVPSQLPVPRTPLIANSHRTSDRSNPGDVSASRRSSSITARAPSPAKRWNRAARSRRWRASAGSSGVSSAASSHSSAAPAVAPRAAACSAAASSSAATVASGSAAARAR